MCDFMRRLEPSVEDFNEEIDLTIKVEMRKVYVVNGKAFLTKKKAKRYQKKLSGDIIQCHECRGLKQVHSWYDDWNKVQHWELCPVCKGKGFLEKEIIPAKEIWK